MKQNLSFYDQFHKKTKFQTKIIKKGNFTYKTILSLLDKYLKKNSKIVDIGCGAGTIDYYLAKKGHKVLGIDISKKSIEACRKTADILNLGEQITFQRLKFPEEQIIGNFNFAICTEVIEHIKDDQKAVKSIYDILKKNGIVIFSTPSKNAPLYKIGYAKKFDEKVGHLRRYSSSELIDLIENNGFRIIEIIKAEGILRNFLFLNSVAGSLIRIINKINFLGNIITFFDSLTIVLFKESNLILVAEKK